MDMVRHKIFDLTFNLTFRNNPIYESNQAVPSEKLFRNAGGRNTELNSKTQNSKTQHY